MAEPDCHPLRAALARQWRQDSSKVCALAMQVQTCYTEGGQISMSNLPKAQADTLLRMYQIGIAHDGAERARWLRERATLALLRPADHASHARMWLMQAIRAEPEEAPRLLISQALQLTIAAYTDLRLPLNEAVVDWAMLDRLMLLRELGGGEDAIQFALLHKHFRLEMRRALPDCNQLMGNFSEQIAHQTLPVAGCQTFLVLYEMQGCDAPSLWEAALHQVLTIGNQAWLNRLAGAEAFNRRAWPEALTYWQQAIALEPDDRLKAVDQLQIAQAWLAEGDQRQARTAIQAAMALHPTWGEPYIRLMDLYLEGKSACNLPAFDQKTLYWLLIELCQTLLNVDPNYAVQANERLYLYKSLAPTRAEAAFIGFRPGDSVPLKCWMSTTTTVPLD
jgi:tetratricopeptide (TPR) repeat protein